VVGASGLGLEPGKVGLEFFQQPVEAVHTVTVVKGRMEVHGFFKQVSAGVSNGVRIKGGGAAPEGAYASGGRSVSASLNGVTE